MNYSISMLIENDWLATRLNVGGNVRVKTIAGEFAGIYLAAAFKQAKSLESAYYLSKKRAFLIKYAFLFF